MIWYCTTHSTGCPRPIAYLIFVGLFPQNSPIISGSVAKDNLHLKASYGSSAPCTAICIWSVIFPQNSPGISGSFAKDDLQHKASYGSSALCAAICIWSVMRSQSPISIALVSFQRNVVKKTRRTRSSIEMCEWRNDTSNAMCCNLWLYDMIQ